jgi:myosin-crossreactive antigen
VERMKIYLDTNTVMDFFINAAKSLKEKKEIKLPKKYQFFASQKEYVKFITSILTKAEIVRELVAAYSMKKEDIEPVWKEFVNALNCHLIEEFKIDMKLIDVVYSLPRIEEIVI